MKIQFRDEYIYGNIDEVLGKGTFGEVVKMTRNEKSVAVKTFKNSNPEFGVPSDAIKEISILSKISHPGIIALIDVIKFDPKIISEPIKMVLEYAPSNLRTYYLKKRLEKELVKSYTTQLSRALLYLHVNNIWHRDIKPANILMHADGRIVLADFGIARFGTIASENYSGVVETLPWRAPEILLGSKHYGSKIDVYALGVVFADMCLQDETFRYNNEKDVCENKYQF